MINQSKPTWQCYFSEAAEQATKGTETEILVAMGRTPIRVQALNKLEAAAEFMNQLNPSGPRATLVLGKTDPSSLQSYIVCERIPG